MIIDDIVYGLERLAIKKFKESSDDAKGKCDFNATFLGGYAHALNDVSKYILRLAETTPELGQYFSGEDSGKEIDLG